MKAICVFCGYETEIPIEEVVIHQEETLTIRPAHSPEPYAEFKIRCPSCSKVFSYPCGVWHGGYGESKQMEAKIKKTKPMTPADLTPEEKLMRAIFGEPACTDGVKHFLSDEGRQAVRDLLDELNEQNEWKRGVKVLHLRFGFEPRTDIEKAKRPGSDARTLEETGVYFNVTRERIRQIEAKAHEKIRNHDKSRRLLSY